MAKIIKSIKESITLKQMIKEELQKVLKEGEGYVELITMDPNFRNGEKLIKDAWDDWRNGPLTKHNMIRPAKQDLIKYIVQQISKW